MKDRVTLTLERGVLSTVDRRIDGVTVKNRSHAIELLLRKALKGTAPSTAVILAGGPQMKPLTGVPKPFTEVQGEPILDINLALCRAFGVTSVIITVGPMKDAIMNHYDDGSSYGMRISYLEEETPLGTAGPLRKLREQLQETFVLMNADELKDVNLEKMYDLHVEKTAKATIALTTVEDPSAYGVAILDGNKIMGFVEKPKRNQAPSKLINAGLYICEPEIIDLVPEGYATLESDVFPKLARSGDLYGYPFSGQWFDTSTPERLSRVRKQWKGFSHGRAS